MNRMLHKKWMQACGQWKIDLPNAEDMFLIIQGRYGEKYRVYHTLDHVERILRQAEKLGWSTPEITMAAFFHDLVYSVKASKNEANSETLARKMLGSAGVANANLQELADCILATRKAGLGANRICTRRFVDLDCGILGSRPAAYKIYVSQIEQEYRSLSKKRYLSGRIKFLQGMLDRNYIFHTKVFRESREGMARRNIKWELEVHLEKCKGPI